MESSRIIYSGDILHTPLRDSIKNRQQVPPFLGGEKDIHMQVMVEDSGIGLEKEILSHTEVMGMDPP